jgi:hypothetical protein
MTLSTMLKSHSTGEAGELINSSDIPDGTKTVPVLPMSNSESGCLKYRWPSWNSKLD